MSAVTSSHRPATAAPEAVRHALGRTHAVWGIGPWRFRFHRRAAAISACLVVGLLSASTVGMLLGDYGIGAGQVLAAVLGRAEDPLAAYFVTGMRAPRVVGALLVGSALGLSGAIFQTVSGNPLGSPDIIGFSTGSATGALLQIVVFGGDTAAIAIGAVVGGLATATVVYALAWRGGVAGFRLVLVGIGIGAALSACNQLLVVRASLVTAQTATQWLAGSLNAVLWPRVMVLAGCLVVLYGVAVATFRPLLLAPFGDEIGTALGVRVQRARSLAVLVGVIAVAVATATTGPIAFVALAAPHLFRRLAHTPGVGLVGPALMGALIVAVSDVLAQRLFAPTQLAVGVVTGALGGTYLVVLLATEWRRSRA